MLQYNQGFVAKPVSTFSVGDVRQKRNAHNPLFPQRNRARRPDSDHKQGQQQQYDHHTEQPDHPGLKDLPRPHGRGVWIFFTRLHSCFLKQIQAFGQSFTFSHALLDKSQATIGCGPRARTIILSVTAERRKGEIMAGTGEAVIKAVLRWSSPAGPC